MFSILISLTFSADATDILTSGTAATVWKTERRACGVVGGGTGSQL